MRFKNHLLFGLLLGLLYIKIFNVKHQYFTLFMILLSSIFVDIDLSTSKIGGKTIPISNIINIIFSHRGIIHSAYIPLLLFLVLYVNGYTSIGIAILIGYIGHLLLDGLTKEGVHLFYPFLDFRGFVKVGGLIEKIIFLGLIVLNIFIIFKFYLI
ncbi:MAG: metal-dependent hydrolase [Candidatus Woesearchaeota archaeon]